MSLIPTPFTLDLCACRSPLKKKKKKKKEKQIEDLKGLPKTSVTKSSSAPSLSARYEAVVENTTTFINRNEDAFSVCSFIRRDTPAQFRFLFLILFTVFFFFLFQPFFTAVCVLQTAVTSPRSEGELLETHTKKVKGESREREERKKKKGKEKRTARDKDQRQLDAVFFFSLLLLHSHVFFVLLFCALLLFFFFDNHSNISFIDKRDFCDTLNAR